MMRPRFSVVVPMLNAETTIVRCIEGLLSQDVQSGPVEILLVDNGSHDRSAELARRYPDVRLLHEAKRGAYAARNRALREASAPLIAFTDPDCAAEPTWLTRLEQAFETPSVGIAMGRTLSAPGSRWVTLTERYEATKDAFALSSGIPSLYYGRTNNMAVRREVFDRVGPFLERRRGSDTIFVQRAVRELSCHVVRYCPDARVVHMEVESLSHYYRKMYTYGRSRRLYSNIVKARALTNDERRKVFRDTVRANRLRLMGAAELAVLLLLGVLYWNLGSLSARWIAGSEHDD